MTNIELAKIMGTMSVFALSVAYGNEIKTDFFRNNEINKAFEFIGEIDIEYAISIDINTKLNIIDIKFMF